MGAASSAKRPRAQATEPPQSRAEPSGSAGRGGGGAGRAQNPSKAPKGGALQRRGPSTPVCTAQSKACASPGRRPSLSRPVRGPADAWLEVGLWKTQLQARGRFKAGGAPRKRDARLHLLEHPRQDGFDSPKQRGGTVAPPPRRLTPSCARPLSSLGAPFSMGLHFRPAELGGQQAVHTAPSRGSSPSSAGGKPAFCKRDGLCCLCADCGGTDFWTCTKGRGKRSLYREQRMSLPRPRHKQAIGASVQREGASNLSPAQF